MNVALQVWPLSERIKSKSYPASGGCIEWKGAKRRGYPSLFWQDNGKPQNAYVHRMVWEMHNGPIPEGKVIMHTCDNKGCVNIDHLRLGTQADNIADSIRKGRQWWQVRNG